MLKAVVLGAGGRMGGRIITMIAQSDVIELGAALEKAGHPTIGKDAGEVAGIGRNGIIIGDNLAAGFPKGDVVIDFTHHSAALEHVELAAATGKAIVIGSTGFSSEEIAAIEKQAEKVRCVLSPNMSVGVNLLFKVLETVAGILGDDYDVEIVETHHNLKKDAPSGTAMRMAQIIATALARNLDEVGVYERKGMIGERSKKEIGIQTIRAGDIVGEHLVLFAGGSERLEFIHRAHSRDNFARGALRAAQWIVTKNNGLYDMQDVLGLKG